MTPRIRVARTLLGECEVRAQLLPEIDWRVLDQPAYQNSLHRFGGGQLGRRGRVGRVGYGLRYGRGLAAVSGLGKYCQLRLVRSTGAQQQRDERKYRGVTTGHNALSGPDSRDFSST